MKRPLPFTEKLTDELGLDVEQRIRLEALNQANLFSASKATAGSMGTKELLNVADELANWIKTGNLAHTRSRTTN